MDIRIDPQLKNIWPATALGLVMYDANVEESSPEQLADFEAQLETLADGLQLADISVKPQVAATRAAYKALGKSPSEYRNSAEAMLRRIVKGSGLYHINNVIEVNNLISVLSGYAIGSYDEEQLQGPVTLVRAEDDAHYDGIGKASVNIAHLPVLRDELGYFGSPTSDSQRAMIQEGKRRVCSVIFAFDGPNNLQPWLDRFGQLVCRYCDAVQVETDII